jgi:hypothetical protein
LAGLFAAVWAIYLGDRLLDARRSQLDSGELPARHAWARRHGKILGACLVLAILAGIVTIPRLDPATLRAGIVVAVATGLYFFLFRWSVWSKFRPRALPAKEIAISVCFSAGAAIAASPRDLGDLPAVELVGLVSLILGNCLLISRREARRDAQEDPAAFFSTPSQARLLPEIALSAGLGLGAYGCWRDGIEPASLALMLCASLTLVLARTRRPVLIRYAQPFADGLHLLAWLVAFLL